MDQTNAIKTHCAVCGCKISDEHGGKDVPLCSEECERDFGVPHDAPDMFDDEQAEMVWSRWEREQL